MSAGASPFTWRVYVTEWVTVYTSDAADEAGGAEAAQFLKDTYAGRVRPEDVRLAVPPSGFMEELAGLPPAEMQVTAQVRRPNLRGEWKARDFADDHAARICQEEGVTPSVVGTGTPEEQALIDYGKRMLPA
jgi:hypothetical protein